MGPEYKTTQNDRNYVESGLQNNKIVSIRNKKNLQHMIMNILGKHNINDH